MRLIDWLKKEQITAILTSLTSGGGATSEPDDSQVGVSSLMDTWLLLRNSEVGGERNRTIFVRKSRGMAHSDQVREFVMSDTGLDLVDVYLGSDRVLTGSARMAQEAHDRALRSLNGQDHQRKLRRLATKRTAIEAQIAALRAEVESDIAEVDFAVEEHALQDKNTDRDTSAIFHRRGGVTRPNGRAVEKQ
jgi:circadian clock protein KaiC